MAVPAGSYAPTIPGENEWTIILSKVTGQCLHHAEKDDRCAKVVLFRLKDAVETMTISVEEARRSGEARDTDKTRGGEARTDVVAKVVAQIAVMAGPDKDKKKAYFPSAMFYYEHDLI